MPVLGSIGVGRRRMLRPLMLLVLPVVGVIAAISLWLGPLAKATSVSLIAESNRNVLVAGLQAGRFTELPGGGGVVYVGSMSTDGKRMDRIFVYRQSSDRLDVATAHTRSEEHTSELQSLMRISYAVFCLKKKKKNK